MFVIGNPILTYGQENISTPVYLQFNNQQQASILVRETNTCFLFLLLK